MILAFVVAAKNISSAMVNLNNQIPNTQAANTQAVAVGVICRGDHVLIAKRAADVHLGNLWEFPGGKVEAGESIYDGLRRELLEEVGIEVHSAEPLIQVPYQYPEKNVLLHVYIVLHFSGEPRGCEGQPLCWVPRHELRAYRFPLANAAIMDALL